MLGFLGNVVDFVKAHLVLARLLLLLSLVQFVYSLIGNSITNHDLSLYVSLLAMLGAVPKNVLAAIALKYFYKL